jgi:hypothetical protein
MSGRRIWHVLDADHTTAEETEESLHRRVIEGSVGRNTLVWTPGLAEWRPAGQVQGLFTPSPPCQTARNPSAQLNERPLLPKRAAVYASPDASLGVSGSRASSSDASRSGTNKRSYISRHWRGELPLAISYWVNGFLLTGAAATADIALGSADITRAPRLLTGAYAGLALLLLAASFWQLVGIWRSAGRTIEERSRLGKYAVWAGFARIATVLGFVSFVANSIQYTLPSVLANLQIAFGGDTTPRHVFKVLNGGLRSSWRGE